MALSGSNCIVQLDGSIYYFDTSLLNRRTTRSNIYLKRLIINGKEYASREIDIGTLPG